MAYMTGLAAVPWQFYQKFREVGLLFTAQIFLRRYCPHDIHDLCSWVISAQSLRRWAGAGIVHPQVRWAGPDELDRINPLGASHAELATRFESGERLAIYEIDGKIVGQNWYSTGVHDHDGWLHFELRPTDVWGYEMWTDKTYRGRGIANRIADFANRHFADGGYDRMIGVIDVLNRNSLRTLEKHGNRNIGRVWFWRCLGFTLIRVDGLAHRGRWNSMRPFALPLARFGAAA